MTTDEIYVALQIERAILNALGSKGPVHGPTLEVGTRRIKALLEIYAEANAEATFAEHEEA